MQTTFKIVLIITFLSFVCFSQNINISGTVIDSGGVGLEGAAVQLEKHGYKDTTGVNGNFTITGIVEINNKFNQSFPDGISANIKNNSLYIDLAEKSRLQIITYNLQGKIISSIRKQLNSGNHSIKLPCTGSGVYFHKIKTGKKELLLKSNSIEDMFFGSIASIKKSSSITTSKTALSLEQIDDVIKSTKTGYLNYRAAITNPDTSGIEIKMISQDAGTVTDIDGNVYSAIRFGDQIWTVENLGVTHYNDGSPIPKIADDTTWSNDTAGAYCYHNNDSAANAVKYGAFYNWHAVHTGKLAPAGWHVPTDAEWDTLQNYLIANGYNWDGTTTGNKIGKSMAGRTDWRPSDSLGHIGHNLATNNSSGFSALPGGCRLYLGHFSSQGSRGDWWSATEVDALNAYTRRLFCNHCDIGWGNHNKGDGFSVRLLRD